MILNRNSWHYRFWATSYEDDYEGVPETTDLCRYCHRVLWQIVAKVAYLVWVAVVAAMFVLLFAYGLIYQGLVKNTKLTLEISAAVLAGAGLFATYIWWLANKPSEPSTLVGQWLHARKQKICPIVEFESKE